jgi:uncharacterized protein YjgD (DUF1641 family)
MGETMLDEATRSGAATALAALVANGDLDRLVALARVLGAAADGISDDTVSRLAGLAADGLDLLDRVTGSGIAAALPALAALAGSGDLERLVALARVAGGVGDALSDDLVTRLAETATSALLLIDRLTRAGLGERLVTAVEAAARRERGLTRPAGGIGGLWQVLRDPDAQAALRFGLAVLGGMREG